MRAPWWVVAVVGLSGCSESAIDAAGKGGTQAPSATAARAEAVIGVVPRSGRVVRSSGTTWFDGDRSRTDYREAGELLWAVCRGKSGSWIAYPGVGRVVTNLPTAFLKTYPEECVARFSLVTNRVPVGEESYQGLPCWRYEWEETNRRPAGMAFTPSGQVPPRVYCALFLANPRFPVAMRSGAQGSWSTNGDVLELSINCPVPGELFAPPADLQPTRQLSLPDRPFEVVVRQGRSSAEHGWYTIETERFTSDGKEVKEWRCLVSGGSGRAPVTNITEATLTLKDASSLICNPIRAELFGRERKSGVEEVLGYRADVWDRPGLDPARRDWVIDHPDFGALAARRTLSGPMPETNEVLSIRVW